MRRGLVGDSPFEPLPHVDVEVPARIAEQLAEWGTPGDRRRRLRRRDRVGVRHADQKGALDRPGIDARAVRRHPQHHSRSHAVVEGIRVGDERPVPVKGIGGGHDRDRAR